ncbi:hypothetical protein BJ912DRAFT_950730 [Pholiota molesta]|nr:hypothetical protein BJ912DRAFT_950730 [Pholiota molesta]
METHIPRGPNTAYADQNGFIQGFTEPEEIEEHNIQNALANHRTAMFVINHKKRAVPDFETMKAQANEPNKLLITKENLKTLHENHTEDLERLYAYQPLNAALEAQWQDDYETLRYTIEKKRREKMFPQSIEDFRRKGKDVQLRTARFLVGTEREKEAMLKAFDWAFAAEMRAIKLTTDTTTDPRRARV